MARGLNWEKHKRNCAWSEARSIGALEDAMARGASIKHNLQQKSKRALEKANVKRSEGPWEWDAAPKMLRDGFWGAVVEQENVRKGDRLHITTKAGKKWSKYVLKVLFQGKGFTICATGKGGA